MKNTSDKIINHLQNKGYRITKARKAIAGVLKKSNRPLSIQELSEQVSADEASVYRTVATLHKEGLIEKILVDGERPHFSMETHHHHHAICNDCGLIEHLPCSGEPMAPKSVPGFSSINSHELTFYGTCEKCA